MGTLRAGRDVSVNEVIAFVEDFGRDQPTCLHQPVRSAAFRRMLGRTHRGEWVPIERGRVSPESDHGNPETPPCANYAARLHPDGLEIAIGGTTVRTPASTVVEIPD